MIFIDSTITIYWLPSFAIQLQRALLPQRPQFLPSALVFSIRPFYLLFSYLSSFQLPWSISPDLFLPSFSFLLGILQCMG